MSEPSVPSAPTAPTVSLATTEALIDAIFLLGRVLRESFSPAGEGHLPRALSGVLLVLTARGECRQNELATDLCVGQSSLSRQITDLVEVGYVIRQADPTDGRAFRIRTSEKGKRYIEQFKRQRIARMQKLLSGWTEAEAATALDAIRHLEETLFDPEHRIAMSPNLIGIPSA